MAAGSDNLIVNCELLAALTEKAADCIWLFDVNKGSFVYVNPSVFDLIGYTSAEALELSVQELLFPQSIEISRAIAERAAQFGAGLSDANSQFSVDILEVVCKDGTIKSIESSIRFIHMSEAESVGIIGVSRDISKWKNREHQLLRELENKDEAIQKLISSDKELASLTLELLAKNETLNEMAITDEMTGLNNRYYFDRRIGEEVERAERYDTPLALIIFDLDRFKQINDTWGHDIGDKVLISVTDVVRRSIRKPDILARWGGEEFVLLVPQTDLLGAAALSDKLREIIATSRHPGVGSVTASFGVAERIAGEPYDSWFRRADQALYQAKSKGRNCVVCSSSDTGTPINLIKLEWKPIWECGHPLIDQQHRHLLDLANSLLEMTSVKTNSEQAAIIFNQLIEQIIHHFTEEEQIIESAGFPDTPRHAERHQNLIKKVLRLNNCLLRAELTPATFFTFLVDEVIMGHMLTEDVLFFPYTRSLIEKEKAASLNTSNRAV